MTMLPRSSPVVSRSLVLLFAAQGAFGLSWSVFLLGPKFMTSVLGASPQEIGRVALGSNLAAVAAIPVVAWLLDRVGRRPLFVVGSLLCAAQAFGFLWVTAVDAWLVALQMTWGVALVVAFNAGNAMVADRAPPDRLAQLLGLFGATNLTMNAVASLGSETLADAVGWSGAFVVAGALGLVAMVSMAWMPPDDLGRADGDSRVADASLLDGVLVRSILAAGCWGISYGTVTVFFQPFVLEQGVDDVSPFFLGFAGAAVGIRIFSGRHIDRIGARRVAMWAMLLYGVTTVSIRWMTGPTLVVFGALLGVAHGLLHPGVAAVVVSGRGPRRRGAALAYTTGGFMAGSAAGAGVMGSVAESSGFPTAFALAGFVTLSGMVLMRGPRRSPELATVPRGARP